MKSMTSSSSDKETGHRRSIDWRDSGIVIDDNFGFSKISCELNIESNYLKDLEQKPRDEDGDTILHLAVVGCSVGVVNDLVMACDLNAVNNMMQAPLHVATLANRPEMVGILVKSCADLGAIDRKGNTPLMLASLKGFIEIADILLRALQHIGGQQVLIEHTKLANFDGQTCLHLAAQANQKQMIGLLTNKYNVNINVGCSKSGETILHKAVRQCNIELVQYICSLNQHCNSQDYSYKTPLHIVQELIESVLNVEKRYILAQIKNTIAGRIIKCAETGNGCCSLSDLTAKKDGASTSSEDEDDFDF